MLIALYILLRDVVIPQLAATLSVLLEPIMTIFIIVGGMVMLFSIVGIKVSNNLGSTVVGGIFQAIGYIVKTVVQAVGWLLKKFFCLIPNIYRGTRKVFDNAGAVPLVSRILAATVTIIAVIIII